MFLFLMCCARFYYCSNIMTWLKLAHIVTHIAFFSVAQNLCVICH